MSDLDKIIVYVPEEMTERLKRDAKQFEVFKKDGYSINMNRLLNQIVLGHYDAFVSERRQLTETVFSELQGDVADSTQRRKVAARIARAISLPTPEDRRIKSPKRLSLKPTKDTESIVLEVRNNLKEDSDPQKLSRYFYSMLRSYSLRAPFERELIVFKKNAALLQEACKSREVVAFATTRNRNVIHHVVPYKLVSGHDDQLNYLLCYEKDNTERPAMTFRLGRINQPRVTGVAGSIPDDVVSHLELMESYGPQYAINEDDEKCVRLTTQGVEDYERSIYHGRPRHERQEALEDGSVLYHFKCSSAMLFNYFKRFGPGLVEVVEPTSLRNDIIKFHIDSLKAYGIDVSDIGR